jgi:hypothetical protein
MHELSKDQNPKKREKKNQLFYIVESSCILLLAWKPLSAILDHLQ